MSSVLVLLGSDRKHGYTATVMNYASEGMKEIPGVNVEEIYLHDYMLAPC